MPLDGHSYLVSQGWAGKGTGLRQGAISRPLAIPQKKNLAGLGKDRDEAFPFWDHLFSAAAKSIQLKVTSDDESDVESSVPEFKRTTTGILSTRRPVTGVSATTSGTSTPDVGDDAPRSNLLSIAKREAAKSNLYARFFRGPVLGPDDDYPSTQPNAFLAEVVAEQTINPSPNAVQDKVRRNKDIGEGAEASSKKRKRDGEDDSERRRRKKKQKERKERKAKEKEERMVRRQERKSAKEAEKLLSLEESERHERKKRKRELKEREKVSLDSASKKKEKDLGSRSRENQCAPIELDGYRDAEERLEHQRSESDRQASKEERSTGKKKRRRKEE